MRDRRAGVHMLFKNAAVYQRILGSKQARNRGESVIRNHGFSPVSGLLASKNS